MCSCCGVGQRERIRGWRKIAAAAWGIPNDPQIYGDLELDATEVLGFMTSARERAGVRVTMTTMVGRAIARALADNPDLNVRMYRGHFVRRETVDVFFIVSAEQGAELSGVKVERADEKGAVEIARELENRASAIRTGDDRELGKTKKVIGSTPRRLLSTSIRASSWLTTDRDMDLKRFGLPRQAFGSTIISSVGMFGVQRAYAPLANYYRIPFLLLVGEVAEKAVVLDGDIVARPMLTLTATMDHRYIDGYHAARLARSVRAYFADPAAHEPTL
jgi:pyruvate/2-oxoglutarate dehydrogenase complex dihydrolipoamide acyltransferase (E2) component